MKIVYLINNTWYIGGQTRVLANKVNYWAEHGYEVYILTTDQINQPPYYPIDPKVKMIDFAIGYIGNEQFSFWKKAKRLSSFLVHHYKVLSQTLKEISPDIVVSMYGKEIYFLPFIKDGSAKVLEAHGARYTWLFSRKGLLGKLHNWLDLRFIRCFDQFVVLTQEDVPNWSIKGTINVPNGNTFEPQDVATLDVPKVIAVGRYGEQKNFENLLHAWAIVHQVYPEWKLKICGQGLDLLDPCIDSLNLRDTVIRYESRDMEREYMDASICALSSRHEGMPMFLLEAMACGLPIVSYACECGPRDLIIDGETGILIEEKQDYNKLAEGIIRLIADEKLRKEMGRKAKKRSSLFSQEAVMQRWTEVFTQLISKKKKQ